MTVRNAAWTVVAVCFAYGAVRSVVGCIRADIKASRKKADVDKAQKAHNAEMNDKENPSAKA